MDESLNNIIKNLKYSIFNRNLLEKVRITESNLMLDRYKLRELQLRKLRELLSFAYMSCPFYRRKYDEVGIQPERIHDFDDFHKVPIITKTEIREHLEEMLPKGIERNLLEEVYTGGTTGVPMKIYRDEQKYDLMTALYLRTTRMWGCNLGTKTVWIWGIPKIQEKQYDFRYQSRIRRFLKNVTWFNAFDMTPESMTSFAHFMNEFRPDLIIGYVSAMYEYAKFLEGNCMRVYAPRAICITAEPSESVQRSLIERVFRTKTFDEYGSSEILRIAVECTKKQGLHIHADSRYVEIIDSSGVHVPRGDIGNIVVTDLENRVMPLIRYKNDDIGSLREDCCECGLHLPMMNYVKGRIYDMITLKSGKKIYGHMFSRVLFNYIEQIKQFQVHQTSFNQIVIRVVPEKLGNFDKFKTEVLAAFKEHTDNAIDYTFEIVDHIKREKSGKLRYVKSDV